MDRIWQSTWDRYRNRYSWTVWAVAILVSVVVVPALGYMNIQPGRGSSRPVDHWASGVEIDRRPRHQGEVGSRCGSHAVKGKSAAVQIYGLDAERH
jgi:hypothetical protein